MSQIDPLPHDDGIALKALRGAVVRLDDATQRFLRGGGGAPIWIALSEALFWVAVLDDRLRHTVPAYFAMRQNDPAGRAVGGLVFARNKHAHEQISAGGAEFEVLTPTIITTAPGDPPPTPGHGTLFTVGFSWIALEALLDCIEEEKHERDLMYQEQVAGHPLRLPFQFAISWFESKIATGG